MIIINMMLSQGRGGIENTFINYCRCLLNINHEVHAIIAKNAAIERDLSQLKGIQIHYLNNLGPWDFWAKWRLKKIVQSIQPDIILAHANRAMSLGMKLQQRNTMIAVAHNYSMKQVTRFKQIITVTQHLKEAIQATSKNEHSIFVLPNMIDVPPPEKHVNAVSTITVSRQTPSLRAQAKQSMVGNSEQLDGFACTRKNGMKTLVAPEKSSNKTPVIGALGRFVRKKGFRCYLEGLAILKARGISFKAVLAGNGEDETKLKALASTLRLDNHLIFKDWMNIHDFFNGIDIFCLPSLHEPFGIVLIEAFAHEKPTVCTMTEGPSEIAEDKYNVLMIQKNDAHDLADKLEILIKDKLLAQQLAEHAKQTFLQQYTLAVVAEQLESILVQVHHSWDLIN